MCIVNSSSLLLYAMRPDNVNSVLIIGPIEVQKSILFQCALHYAEQGIKVLYISSTSLSAIPSPIHGVSPPSTAALSHIRFMYLPRWQDLLHQLFSIHQHTHMSSVVVVDGLNHYCSPDKDKSNDEKHEHKMHAALVCASLIDSMSVCSKHTGKQAVLIASFQSDSVKVDPFIDTFFSNSVWLVESNVSCGTVGIELTNLVSLPQLMNSRTRIEFRLRNWDGTLVLHKILQLVYVKEELRNTEENKFKSQLSIPENCENLKKAA